MPYIPAVIEIVDSNGERVDLPVNGVQQPIALKLDTDTLEMSSRDRGDGVTEVSIAVRAQASDSLGDAYAVALTNIDLANPDFTAANWDGVSPTVGNRVLTFQQNNPIENGTWIVGNASLTRPRDVIAAGSRIYVEHGEVYAGKSFVQQTTGTITIGSTSQNWQCVDGPSLAAPLTTLTASGAGAWVTLLTVPGPTTNSYDFELIVDNIATKSDGSIVARSRGATTYRRASSTTTLVDDSRYLVSTTNLQQVVSGSNILLQGYRQAAGGGDYTFRIRAWFEAMRSL